MAIILKDVGTNKNQVVKVYCEVIGGKLDEVEKIIEDVPVIIEVLDEKEAIKAFTEAGAVAVLDEKETMLIDSVNEMERNVVPECNMIKPDEVALLNRNELLSVLSDIKKLTRRIDEYYNEIISKSSEAEKIKAHAQEIMNAVSGWVYGVTFILILVLSVILVFEISWFGVVLAIVGGIVIYKNVLKPIDMSKNRKQREMEAENYLTVELVPLQQQIKQIQEKIETVQSSEESVWAMDILGDKLFNTESVDQLIDIVKSRRADNLKEALNKYDSTEHTNRMEEMQMAIQNASEIVAEESVKQTVYAKETAKSSHQAATAAKATAYHTRRIDKNTRKFRK